MTKNIKYYDHEGNKIKEEMVALDSINRIFTLNFYTKENFNILRKTIRLNEYDNEVTLGYKLFSKEKTGGKIKIAEMTQEKDSSFLLKTWYSTGKPRILYAYFPAKTTFSTNILNYDMIN